jgi:hypothetical protein
MEVKFALRKTDEVCKIRTFLALGIAQIFCNPILFAICTSTFSKLCINMYTVACRRVLTSTPL